MARGCLRPARIAAARVAALAVGLLLTVGVAAPSLAHSVLLSSDPEDGAVLPAAPERIELVFDGDVVTLGTQLQVTGPDGVVATGPPQVDGTRVVTALPAGLPAGEYEVLWRVTSADGHPISDELGFTASGEQQGSAATGSPSSSPPAPSGSPSAAASAPATTGPTGSDAADTGATEPTAATSAGWPWGWLLGIALAVGVATAVLALVRRRGGRP